MKKSMRPDEALKARFEHDGLVFPIPVLEADEAAQYLSSYEAMVAARGGRLPKAFNAKTHLLVPWLWDLVHDPRVVDVVEEVLGPDILCWGTSFITKHGGDGRYVTWHQDATHWKLSSPEAVTAWVALTPSDRNNGCVRAVPGTHHVQLAHDHPEDPNNMLGRREQVVADIDEETAVDIVLRPGEMSIHHPLIIHGSEPNLSSGPRVGFAIRYIPASIRQLDGLENSATLVRGRDHGTFVLEQEPEGEFHPEAVKRHRMVLRRGMSVIFGDAVPPAEVNGGALHEGQKLDPSV
ncbi:phytanoyl-CoA dioxygenase family protein [Mesorhizobium sp. LHD-90]|uniref:phytanoyl-CoA dioxygenase family protein n=1 Tax=Mesorhizobium sp. LHD-90 TaxID=3071414 RepID=UPI0027E19689|nr:phytanoyl-CoA dioxygenase family protein [Mesorhizobium sp. LHD-90]MDQ6437385.1 phytanoyl-CoA dioxygenase family protein [Mesorhizobium sp. LHD-90]